MGELLEWNLTLLLRINIFELGENWGRGGSILPAGNFFNTLNEENVALIKSRAKFCWYDGITKGTGVDIFSGHWNIFSYCKFVIQWKQSKIIKNHNFTFISEKNGSKCFLIVKIPTFISRTANCDITPGDNLFTPWKLVEIYFTPCFFLLLGTSNSLPDPEKGLSEIDPRSHANQPWPLHS